MRPPISDKSALEVTDSITKQAAQWIVLLTADEENERTHARTGYEAWRQADPRHAAAAMQMESFINQVRNMRQYAGGNTKPARAALNTVYSLNCRRKRIKRLGTIFALVVILAIPAWMILQTYSPSYLMADIRTVTGEWKTQILSDNTRLILNTASAVNLHYDDDRRTIELIQGEILVDVAKETDRPFLVKTLHGSIHALGTRFIVRHTDQATLLTMLESKVAIQTAAQLQADFTTGTIVRAGQQIQITANHISPTHTVDIHNIADAWKHRRLVINDWPLPKVLNELNRHRPGHIQYDRTQLETIRISAVLPLDNTDRALQLLATNFPTIQIRTITPYLVLVNVNK